MKKILLASMISLVALPAVAATELSCTTTRGEHSWQVGETHYVTITDKTVTVNRTEIPVKTPFDEKNYITAFESSEDDRAWYTEVFEVDRNTGKFYRQTGTTYKKPYKDYTTYYSDICKVKPKALF